MPTPTLELALSILEHMEVAILKRNGPMDYCFYGHVPKFYREMFCGEDAEINVQPWLMSPMLEFFITDAESFFERGLTGQTSSGIWREDGVAENTALYAEAVFIDEVQLLLLRSLDKDYVERIKILQKAREQLLEQRELRSSLETFKYKARYDSLTGLFNRATLMEAMNEEISVANNTGETFSFLLMDIDNFKKVNDTYGHLAGDSVLATIGQMLVKHRRRGDIAARYGGEELVILASGTSKAHAFMMAENLRKRIEKHNFHLPQQITVSIGCTAYVHGESIESVIARADQAMYEAKRSTKNLVVVR
jgi:diguanylate cyclase (GGDEF)-like protein